MVRKAISYFKNMLKYIKSGGVVYVNVSYTEVNKRLQGKTVFVSGGTSGIGKGIATLFLAEGANVIVSGRNEKHLSDLKKELPDINVIQWDVADVEVSDSKIIEMVSKYGRIDIFINNAGVFEADAWNAVSEKMYDKCVNINQKGLYFMCQSEGRYFVSNNIHGKIINITSIAGIKSGFDPYSVSKWGATCITKGIAKELVGHGIIVNGIAPGNVVTNIHDGVKGKNVNDNAYMPNHLTKRYTLVEEIASLALFLAGDSSNNMVGQIIAVDGGWTLN